MNSAGFFNGIGLFRNINALCIDVFLLVKIYPNIFYLPEKRTIIWWEIGRLRVKNRAFPRAFSLYNEGGDNSKAFGSNHIIGGNLL